MLAAYFYYAIPTREFRMPTAPYQAAFWVLAIATSWRYRSLSARWAREEVDRSAGAIALETAAAMRAPIADALVSGAVAGLDEEELAGAVSRAMEAKALDVLGDTAPELLVAPISAAIGAIIESACREGAADAVSARASASGTPGAIRAAIAARVRPVIERALDERLEETVVEMVDRLAAEDERVRGKRRVEGRGPFDLPLERGPLLGALTNPGLWLHLAFVLLTWIGAENAAYDRAFAMTRVGVAALLLVPMVGIVVAVRTARHWRMFMWAWMAGVAHLCVNGIDMWLRYGGRADMPGGQGNEANFLGAIAVVVVPVALSMAVGESRRSLRAVGAVAAAIFFAGILASGSRGALLALAVAMGYWLLTTDRKLAAFGIASLGLAAFLAVAPGSFWERMGTMFLPEDTNPWIMRTYEPSANERVMLWDLAIQIWEEHPWFGIGPQQFVIESEALPIVDAYFGARGMQTHNSWLQIASEYGAVGLSVWGLAFALPWVLLRRARRRLARYADYAWFGAYCTGLEAGLIGCGVAITFSSFHWLDFVYWGMVFGPLAYQIARDTGARLDWYDHDPKRAAQKRPPARSASLIPATPAPKSLPPGDFATHELEEVTHFHDDPNDRPTSRLAPPLLGPGPEVHAIVERAPHAEDDPFAEHTIHSHFSDVTSYGIPLPRPRLPLVPFDPPPLIDALEAAEAPAPAHVAPEPEPEPEPAVLPQAITGEPAVLTQPIAEATRLLFDPQERPTEPPPPRRTSIADETRALFEEPTVFGAPPPAPLPALPALPPPPAHAPLIALPPFPADASALPSLNVLRSELADHFKASSRS